jgi:hypothetical protein
LIIPKTKQHTSPRVGMPGAVVAGTRRPDYGTNGGTKVLAEFPPPQYLKIAVHSFAPLHPKCTLHFTKYDPCKHQCLLQDNSYR